MPATSKDHVPLFRIVIGGADLDPVEMDFVHEIKITNWLRLPDVCTLQIGYPADGAGAPFDVLDSSAFEIGKELEVRMGSMGESTTQSLFQGEVVTLEPDFHAGGVAMVLRAYDKTHRMMRSRKQRAFQDQTASDIVAKVCQEHGLSCQAEASGTPYRYLLQHNETDFDFILRLGRRIGFEFTVDAGTAHFAAPNPDAQPDLELNYPEDLSAFRPRITAVQQVEKVNVRGFDLTGKRAVFQSANSARQVTSAGISRKSVASKFPGAVLEIAGQSFKTASEAQQMAQASLDQLANGYLSAEGSCHGNPKIKPGAVIKITGVGRNYSGTYRVAKAVHVVRGGGGYVTQFSNSAGEHSLLGQSSGNGSGPLTINSIVIGVVTNNKDPDGMGRVRVKLPAVSDVETFWAPVGIPSAGKERGVSMLPMPNDQVIVAFENGDPSHPYVIGALFSGRDLPGSELALADGSFALRSDHKATLHTKEDMTLHVDKGALDIQVDNGDIKENVRGSGGGYDGKFAGEYRLEATRGVTVDSKQAVTIQSNQSVTIKAPSITVDASMMLALKGGMIDIKASGIVTIAGSMINIG